MTSLNKGYPVKVSKISHFTDSKTLQTLQDHKIYASYNTPEALRLTSLAECYAARNGRTSSMQLTTWNFEKIPLTKFFAHINPTQQHIMSSRSWILCNTRINKKFLNYEIYLSTKGTFHNLRICYTFLRVIAVFDIAKVDCYLTIISAAMFCNY